MKLAAGDTGTITANASRRDRARVATESSIRVERFFAMTYANPAADPRKKHELLESATTKTPVTIRNGGVMQAQLITYQLKDISQAEYLQQMVEPDAPVLANVPGLISKTWLADEEKNTFGGFYLWDNKTAMEDFMHSDLVKAVVSRPFVKNVSSVDFEVNQNASVITRGLR
jgi:hypothetical protein